MFAELIDRTEDVEVIRHQFTVAEFLRMAEVGLLAEDDRVELIHGEIIRMSPINVAHASTVSRLLAILHEALGKRVILNVQNPIQLDDKTLPQPDIALLHPREDFYSSRHPRPEDAFLLIEVADSTVRFDVRVKSILYGASGLTEYWVVDLPSRQIAIFRGPHSKGFSTETRHGQGKAISPLAFPDLSLSVSAILGASD